MSKRGRDRNIVCFGPGIDATTNQCLEEEFKLGGELESFQLECSGPNICVNIPDLKQIAVINRNTKEIAHWSLSGLRLNFSDGSRRG
jgi:hypothetical protein